MRVPQTVAVSAPPVVFFHPKNQRLLWPAAAPERSIQGRFPLWHCFRKLREARWAGSARPLLRSSGALHCLPDKESKHCSLSPLMFLSSPLFFLSGLHCPSLKPHPAASWKPHLARASRGCLSLSGNVGSDRGSMCAPGQTSPPPAASIARCSWGGTFKSLSSLILNHPVPPQRRLEQARAREVPRAFG